MSGSGTRKAGNDSAAIGNVALGVLVVGFVGGIAFQQAIGFRLSVEWALGFLLAIAVVVFTVWLVKRPPKAAAAYLLLVLVFFLVGCINATRIVSLGNKKNATYVGAGNYRSRQTGWEKARDKMVNVPPVTAARKKIEVACREVLPAGDAGLLEGLLIGETRRIPQEVKDDFKATGLSHILAVSGLNVTILIITVGAILSLITMDLGATGRLVSLILTLLFIVAYMVLTKMMPSVVRAGAMGVAGLTAIRISRPVNPFAALSAAAFAILAVDPAALFDAGFQLSFAATLAILTLTPRIEWFMSGLPSFAVSAVAVTLAAQVGTTPIIAAHFGRLSLISPLANALVTPSIPAATVLGIVVVMTRIFIGGGNLLTAIFTTPVQLLLAYTSSTARILASWPLASMRMPAISWPVVVIYYLVMAIVIAGTTAWRKWSGRPVFQSRTLARTITVAAIILAVILTAFTYQASVGRPPSGLRVTFFDVGQGDAALIQAEDGATILIDGGPYSDSAITPLRAAGVSSIDLMLVTHAHSDHIKGILAVIRAADIGEAILPPDNSETDYIDEIKKALAGKRTRETKALDGQIYRVGKYLTVKIFAPDSGQKETDDPNNLAVVALVEYKGLRILFSGDIESVAEQDLISDGQATKVDILKVPHHGSRDAGYYRFLKEVDPEIAVISVGAGNPYHHPAPSTVAKLKDLGAKVYRTDRNGSVTIESDGKQLSVLTSD